MLIALGSSSYHTNVERPGPLDEGSVDSQHPLLTSKSAAQLPSAADMSCWFWSSSLSSHPPTALLNALHAKETCISHEALQSASLTLSENGHSERLKFSHFYFIFPEQDEHRGFLCEGLSHLTPWEQQAWTPGFTEAFGASAGFGHWALTCPSLWLSHC